jgi:hypothetical protein
MQLLYLRFLILAAVGLCLPLAAQTPQPSLQVNRITAPIDDSNRVSLPGNIHPLAQARFDRGPAPLSMPTGRLLLVLQPSAAQQRALLQYLADLQNPGAPAFHQWLTPAQYGARFGPSDSDLQTIESWLQSHGFKVDKVPQARNIIQFSGSIDQLQTAFHTAIHTFSVNGETHYANVTDPQIPAALASIVTGVAPLNDFHPKPGVQLGATGRYDPTTHTIQPDLTLFGVGNGAPNLFVDPADAATIYDTPNANLNANYTATTYDGAGVSIGIVGTSDLTLADVTNYRTAFLGETSSSVNLPTVVIDGNDPGLTGAADEALLDNEIAGGIAPKAKIYFYTSADTDLSSGLMNAWYRALDDNTVSILNLSFSGCEAAQGTAGNQALLEAAEQAAAQGISVTVSTGDGGSAGCDDFDTAALAQYGLAVNGIASTPYTIAVGGTDFDVLSSSFSNYVSTTNSGTAPYYRTALGYIPEEPWNNSTTSNTTLANNVAYRDSSGTTNIVAGGGGVSTVYSKPAFQSSLTPNDNARDLPDVSLFAANGFYQAYWAFCSDNVTDGNPNGSPYTECQTTAGQLTASSTFGGAGGTSASAPAFAAMLALVEQKTGSRLGQADYVLYQLAQSKYSTVFHDVTSGNNSVPCAGGTPQCGSNGFLTGYNAGTGYDLASGLGSVDVAAMANSWSSVSLTSTSTTLAIDNSTAPVTAVHGKSLTFQVGVNPSSATGVVGIVDSASETSGAPQNDGQFSIALTSGSGSATWNGLPGGAYTVSAHYGGDTSDASSSSTPITVTISPEASTTALSINAENPNSGASISNLGSIPYGSQVVLDAQITGAAEGSSTQGLATGTVTYSDGSTTLGTASVSSSNLASYPPLSSAFSVFAVGSHNVTAKYSGDPSYNPSASSPVAFTIVPASTSISASASSTSISAGQSTSISFAVTTTLNLGAAPGGSVQLTANGQTLATVTNFQRTTNPSGSAPYYELAGSATIQASQLTLNATNVITVTYSGDPNYAIATTTVSVNVTGSVPSFTLANSGNITAAAGSTGTSTLTLTPAGGFTGEVLFACVVSGNPPINCITQTATVTGTAPVTSTLTAEIASNTPAGNYAATVTARDVATGAITATTTVTISVTASSIPAIVLSNSGGIAVNAGATSGNSSVITVMPAGGFSGQVNLTCAVTSTPSSPTSPATCAVPSSVTITGTSGATATLTAATTASTTPGIYIVTVTGTNAAGGSVASSTTVNLTVNPPTTADPAIGLASGGNIAVNPGATTGNTSAITVTPSNGFTGQVNLSCTVATSVSNPTDPPVCALPSSVSVSGTTAVTATLTVTTTAPVTAALDLPEFFLAGGGATLALVLLFGIPARSRAWRTLFSLLAVVVLISGIGCGTVLGSGGNGGGNGGGGNASPGTAPGAYTITVTAADAATGKITAAATVTLTVN